jgi:Na+/melibiose symporter-like transporter
VRGSAAEQFETSPFTKLARVHALSISCDALVTVSLAGSLFFSIPTGQAREKVTLYLLLTMAPFAIVAPLVGPAIDRIRGGRRLMVLLACALRAGVCLLMAQHLDDLFLFPLAFIFLVLGRSYGIAKSALVPTVVDNDFELVRANSRLSLLSGIVGVAVGAIAAGIAKVAGSESTLVLGAVAGGIGAVLAMGLAPAIIAEGKTDPVEEVELKGAGIQQAAEAMGLLRGIVGFITFLLAFALRGGGTDGPVPVGLSIGHAVHVAAHLPTAGTGQPTGEPTWHFGVVLVFAAAGGIFGALVAPRLRQFMSEERILLFALIGCAGVTAVCAFQGDLLGSAVGAMTVGLAASVGRLAFDSLVQRDAPDANFGRSFARFETRFQLVWVIGAFIPVIVPMSAQFGLVVVSVAAGFAAFAYYTSQRNSPRPDAVTVAPSAVGPT